MFEKGQEPRFAQDAGNDDDDDDDDDNKNKEDENEDPVSDSIDNDESESEGKTKPEITQSLQRYVTQFNYYTSVLYLNFGLQEATVHFLESEFNDHNNWRTT